MKRILSIALLLCLLLSAFAAARAGEWGPDGDVVSSDPLSLSEPTDDEPFTDVDTNCPGHPWEEGALFDEGVQKITVDPWGNQVDFAYVGGWTVNRGYYEGGYHITGWLPDGTERIVLATDNGNGFMPADGAIVHYGMDELGMYGWMISRPGEGEPADPFIDGAGTSFPEDNRFGWTTAKLPIGVTDTVFYVDDEHIWYYTYAKAGKSNLYRVDHEGKGKKKLGTVSGSVVTMMPGQEVLLADFGKNQVRLWKSGKYETIYSPKEDLLLVASTGKGVWVQHRGWYGPLSDGEVTFRLPGRIVAASGSTDQFVALVLPREDAAFFHVLMFNETYRAYAEVGSILRQENTYIEVQKNQTIIWGPEESRIFEHPIPELWLPYGYLDYSSAENLRDDASWMELLVGSWCAAPYVGAGYAERLIFTRDELYRLPNQEGKAKMKPVKSTWTVSEGRLYNYVDRDSPRRLWLSGPFTVPDREGAYTPKIMIDGVTYYMYSDDPGYFEDLKAYGITIEP